MTNDIKFTGSRSRFETHTFYQYGCNINYMPESHDAIKDPVEASCGGFITRVMTPSIIILAIDGYPCILTIQLAALQHYIGFQNPISDVRFSCILDYFGQIDTSKVADFDFSVPYLQSQSQSQITFISRRHHMSTQS